MEPRQCRTSVLEALMGFNEQKSQHHAPRHSRVLSESYLQRVASVGIPKKKSPSRCHPFRMTIEEPSEFFSSLEVEDNFSRCNNREKGDSVLSITRQMNEKHFSTDKVIQTSKDFQDLPEVIDSMDILPRPTREKTYIPNHVENGSSVSKSHYTLTEGNNDAGTKFKESKQGQAHSSVDLDLLKSSRPFSEWGDQLYFSSSSPTSLKGSHLVNDKCTYFYSSLNGKHIAEEKGRTMEYAPQPIKQPSEVSDILDGHRKKTRHDFVNLHLKTSRSESIYDDVHRKETECERTSSPGLSNWRDKNKHSFYFSADIYKAREIKEKVTEEQRKTENFMLSPQGRKMKEMSILPHYATLPSDLNCKLLKYDDPNHICSTEKHLHSGSPLCLSCKDKRLDQLGKNSPRLHSDSASTVTAGSITRSRYEALRNTWFLKPEGHGTWLQFKPLNRSSNKKDTSKPTLKLNSKKLKIFPCPDSASDHVGSDGCMVGYDLKTRVEKKYLVEPENQAVELSLKRDYQDENISSTASSDVEIPTVDNQESDSLSCILTETDGDLSANSSRATCTSIQQEGFAFEHCPRKEPYSVVNLEEAFQPSPVSVLEPFFREETLSSFESSGINSGDLMMQLELLMSDSPRINSEEYDLFISSDDSGEGSRCSYDEIDAILSTFKFKDSRDFSYIVDVLSEAGFHCGNMEKGYISWIGKERHVIRPSVFENLEKKFGEQDSWRRSERKLLFDRINAGLVELFPTFIGVPEWAKPVSRRFRPLLDQETIEEELWILLDSQEREMNKELIDKQFGKEIGWIELEEEIDSICREVERLLINELVAEFGSNKLF